MTIQEAINRYKTQIAGCWRQENYKWIAVKHFQENWDIDAVDFPEMLNRAFALTKGLLDSGRYFACKMVRELTDLKPEKMRELFRTLYDEERPLGERIDAFKKGCEELLTIFRETVPGREKAKNSYQDLRAICAYLSLRYPDKYFLFKRTMYDAFKKKVGFQETSSAENSEVRKYENYAMLCEEIIKQAKADEELIKGQKELVSAEPKAYVDPQLHLLAQTIIYINQDGYEVLSTKGKKSTEEEENEYWPPQDEYPVNISKEEWKKYIEEIELPNQVSGMKMLKGLMELGGEASCKKLSEVYGGGPSRYIGIAVNIGKRAKKYFNLPPCMDGEVERFFPIPFLGRGIVENGSDYYTYRIRDELFEALKEIDLSSIRLHAPGNEKYTKTEFLREVFMAEDDYTSLVSLLENKKNIILQGAPGVGKTFAAKRLAYSIMGEKDDDRIEFVQFHQNYSYEDFVMGYRPNETGFELKYGIFYRFCEKAAGCPEDKYFFIIDEINRGNMSKIFGELLMLIEKDYRGEDTTLSYNGMAFSVPENLYIIGMMNTADRSLAMIDYALRRRFSFYNIAPGFESEGFRNYQKSFKNGKLNNVVTEVIRLNETIANDKSLGAGFCIGHSYFCGHKPGENDNWINEVVDYDIIPMLNEYWFDDANNVSKWSEILKGACNG
jgi:5-methylcytosine-specific restriction protein B